MKTIFLDALNFSHNFYTPRNYWQLDVFERKVKKFLDACLVSGYRIEAYIDSAILTPQTMGKWRVRREKEFLGDLQNNNRKPPTCWATLYGDILRKYGADVYYSLTCDNDDLIAVKATNFNKINNNALVLSSDLDFLRYTGRKYELFKSFQIRKGRIFLEKQTKTKPKPGTSYIDINSILNVESNTLNFPVTVNKPFYFRGIGSILSKHVENINVTLMEYREDLISELLPIGTVIQWTSPIWNQEKSTFEWVKGEFEAKQDTSGRLQYPDLIIDDILKKHQPILSSGLFKNQLIENHEFSVHVLVYEMFVLSGYNTENLSLLDMMKM
ncbi:hypothetical protein HK096_002857, partial [Nowakowskiella sp. JEL0078]